MKIIYVYIHKMKKLDKILLINDKVIYICVCVCVCAQFLLF